MTEAEAAAVDEIVAGRQASLTRDADGSLIVEIGDLGYEVAEDGTVKIHG